MSIYKTQGIILRRKNFFESDRLLTIYTRDYGKIKVVAKGSRKILSKLGGHLELFYLVDLMLAKGKSLDIITSVQIIESHKNIRKNKYLINRAYYISELIDSSTQLEAENEEIFELIDECFKSFDNYSSSEHQRVEKSNKLLHRTSFESKNNVDKKILRYFELKLISILGHYPELTTCVICKKSLEYKYHGFSYIKGGIVGLDCNNSAITKASPDTIKFMRLVPNKNWDFIKRIKIDEKTLSELKKINQEILDHIIEREIKSKRFL